MSDKEILTKAIEKAADNGWKDFDGKGSYLDIDFPGVMVGLFRWREFIFSHDFAKAFWGKNKYCSCGYKLNDGDSRCRGHFELEKWEYELREIVLEKNPIKYLEHFLPQNKERER